MSCAIVNVGGFGHTGNAALLDFLIDTDGFSPAARDFGETSILRGEWCISGMIKALSGDNNYLDSGFYFDAFCGIVKDEHREFFPPDINDFKRNARVVSLYGEDYVALVGDFIDDFRRAVREKSSPDQFIVGPVKNFYQGFSRVCLVRSNSDSVKYMLTRNDPAGYAISLLSVLDLRMHFSIIRNPIDVAYDWCMFYYNVVDDVAVRKFSSQFCKKIDRFSVGYGDLCDDKREKVKLIFFEDVVRSEVTRASICKLLGLKAVVKKGRFSSEESMRNVGIGGNIDDRLKSIIYDSCMKKYDDFVRKYEECTL